MRPETAYTSFLDLVFTFFASVALLTVSFSSLIQDESNGNADFVVLRIDWNQKKLSDSGKEPSVRLSRRGGADPPTLWTFPPEKLLPALQRKDPELQSVYFLAELPAGEWELQIPAEANSWHLTTATLEREFSGTTGMFAFSAVAVSN